MLIVVCNLKEKTIQHFFNVLCYKKHWNNSAAYEGTCQLAFISASKCYPEDYAMHVIDLAYSEYHVFEDVSDFIYQSFDWEHYFD